MKSDIISPALILFLVIAARSYSDEKDAAKADLAKLQGEWAMVTGSADGQAMPPAMLASARRVCRDNETTVMVGGQLIMKAKFSLDAAKAPKMIDYDVVDGPTKGRRHLGIYEFDGEQVKFCFGSPDAPRPTDFTSQAGDGRTLSTWKRAAPAAQ